MNPLLAKKTFGGITLTHVTTDVQNLSNISYRANHYSSNVLDLHCGGTRFVVRLGYRLSSQRFSLVLLGVPM